MNVINFQIIIYQLIQKSYLFITSQQYLSYKSPHFLHENQSHNSKELTISSSPHAKPQTPDEGKKSEANQSWNWHRASFSPSLPSSPDPDESGLRASEIKSPDLANRLLLLRLLPRALLPRYSSHVCEDLVNDAAFQARYGFCRAWCVLLYCGYFLLQLKCLLYGLLSRDHAEIHFYFGKGRLLGHQ